MTPVLRPYQETIIAEIRTLMQRGIRSILTTSPTGSGKTVLTAHMLRTAAAKGMHSFFNVHRRELVTQSARTFKNIDVPFGIVSAGFHSDTQKQIQICSVQSLARRMNRLREPALIVWDECIAGDSVLHTNVGEVKIRDIPWSGAFSVRSFDGKGVTWQPIKAWRRTGKKRTLKILLSSGQSLRATTNHPVFTKNGWTNTGLITTGDHVLCLPQESASASWGHSSATPLSDSLTNAVSPHVLRPTTQPSKPSGPFINQESWPDLTQGFQSSETVASETSLSGWLPRVCRASLKSMTSFVRSEKNKYPSSGSIRSESLDSRGGSAMMASYPKISTASCPPGSILRALAGMAQRLSRLGWSRDTARPPSTTTSKVIGWWPSPLMGLVRSSEKSSGMSPSACDTNWVKVIEISDCFEEDVYDISVDGTHCFFANGMLVHNCHHIAAASWTKIFQAYPKAFHIGLTATPARLDGAGLGDFFQAMVHGPSVGWLIENGYLSPYKIYAPAGVNLSGVHMRMGDFKKAELNVALDKPTITGDAIREYRKRAMGKRAIAFCVSIEHSKHVVASFNAAGIPAVHVDGETDVHVRDQAIKDFEAGRTMVLSNVDLFGEGFDLPAIEVGILLRPTASLGLYLQQVGRVLRTYPGKRESILLDHAGNVMRHGLPDDERDWSLRGVIRDSSKSVGAGPSVRVCPKCFAANRSLNPKCCDCGHVFEIQAREVAQVEGELVEVDPKLLQRQRRFEQSRAETLEDIIALGTQRGYKNPKKWAEFIWNARQQKRAAKVTV